MVTWVGKKRRFGAGVVTPLLILACGGAAALACSSSGENAEFGSSGTGGDSSSVNHVDVGEFGGSPGTSGGDPGASSGGSVVGDHRAISSIRIDPQDATLDVVAGNVSTKDYRVFGRFEGDSQDTDITARAVFYVPDNYLVGGFPSSGAPKFSTRVPLMASDPAARGGVVTVRAQAASADGTVLTSTTSLTVRISASTSVPVGTGESAIPGNASSLFGGPSDASRAPRLSYPNDNAFLPPNLKRLEVHWRPAQSTSLYEIAFTSSTSTQRFYARCAGLGDGALNDGACGFQLDGASFAALAESNRGAGNVAVQVRASDGSATGGVGASATFHVRFGETNVEGGIYYWDVTHTRIMRYDFGGTQSAADVFLAGNDYGLPSASNGNCVGCHSISRDGTKIVASIGGQGNGNLVYLNDLAKVSTPPAPARTDTNYLTKRGPDGTGPSGSAIQFATFNPSGSRFAAVYGDTSDVDTRTTLWMHDGTSGDRLSGVKLDFEPDHPDWSPDGSTIAVTHVNGHNTSQQAYKGGIDLLKAPGGEFTTSSTTKTTLLPFVSGKNRFNPSFMPDSSFLLYTEATCPNDDCNTDVEGAAAATTWAITPTAGAHGVHLDNAAAMGVADTDPTSFRDTFPRATPFESKQGSGKRFWFTSASRRQPGERKKIANTPAALVDVRGRPGEGARRPRRQRARVLPAVPGFANLESHRAVDAENRVEHCARSAGTGAAAAARSRAAVDSLMIQSAVTS